MEQFVIEQLTGVNRNAVEGVTQNPDTVKGFGLKRAGGYIPIGGINDSWLGERDLSLMLLETGSYILFEDSSVIASPWRPAGDLRNKDYLAYDENAFVLLSGPSVWLNNRLGDLTGNVFQNQTRLSLVPRSGILAPWQRTFNGYLGGAWYLDVDDKFTTGNPAGTATFTEVPGTGILSGTYEILWLTESPTENGLVVHNVGRDQYTVASSSAISGLRVELSNTYMEGAVTRFYYRPVDTGGLIAAYQSNGLLNAFNSATMERFAVVVNNGSDEPAAELNEVGSDWLPTEEVLINFAPGRVEAHRGRVWGVAGEVPFIPFVPDSAIVRAGGFMLLSEDGFSEVRQQTTISPGNTGLRQAEDYIEFDLALLSVKRVRTDAATSVELFDYSHVANSDERMFGYLEWTADSIYPHLKVFYAVDTTTAFMIVDTEIRLNQFLLGTARNSLRVSKNVTVKVTLKTITNNGDGTITVTSIVNVSGGEIPLSQQLNETLLVNNAGAWAAWQTYATDVASVLAIGSLPAAFAPAGSNGLRELRFTRVELGNLSTVLATADIADYDPTVNLTSWTSGSPNGETWSTNMRENMIVRYAPANVNVPVGPAITPDLTLVYSTVGSVNRGTLDNFIPLSPLTSRSITALTSTPAGLVVFLENETFLVRGDPATNDLLVQRLSGTLGNDDGVIPARLGSLVAPIYKGEIYGVDLGGGDVDFGGSMVNLSAPVWVPSDPFVQVVGENVRNHLVALTASGRVYRFDVQTQQWLNDPFDELEGLRWLSAACECGRYGTRYNVNGFFEVLDSEIIGTPEFGWEAMDLGAKNIMKLWRRIELFTEGVGDGAPVLEYDIRGISGEVTGLHQGGGRWVFTLPRGMVGPLADLKFKFPGATRDLVVEPPVVIDYAVRYRER